MASLRIICYVIRTDFLERIRRSSFLIVIALTAVSAFFFVPQIGAGYTVLSFSDYRGIYNAALIGNMIAILTSCFMSLVGFYLVKNSIELDNTTRLGQIIASTPIHKSVYIIGKVLGNFIFLMAMVFITILMAFLMLFMRGEDKSLDLIGMVTPFIFIVLPVMAVISMLAVLFECLSWLKGSLGNVLYFFIWISALTYGAMTTNRSGSKFLDWLGISIPINSIMKKVISLNPSYKGNFILIGSVESEKVIEDFTWQGVGWTAQIMVERFLWLIIALLVTLLTGLLFKRFDPSNEGVRSKARTKEQAVVEPSVMPVESNKIKVKLSRLPKEQLQFSIIGIFKYELSLMLKKLPLWWGACFIGLIIAGIFVETEFAYQYILPIAWIWPIAVWSSMGTREIQQNTNQIVFSSPYILKYQFISIWFAGIVVTFFAAIGVLINFLIAGEILRIMALLVATIFIPSMALALGVWSQSSKMFEVAYALLWYLGPLNHTKILDYIGSSYTKISYQMLIADLALAILLVTIARIGRYRQTCLLG
jgi:hypothetical protein